MRVIEQLLFELCPEDMSKNLDSIEAQMEYYTEHAIDVQGISLIPIADKLSKKHTSESLRKNGYILTMAQLFDDCEKYLKLANDQPILFNAQLKRLYRGIEVFKRNILAGEINNSVAIAEFKKFFSETIKKIYLEGTVIIEKMPKELSSLIGKLVVNEIKSVNFAWYKGLLIDDSNRLFTELLAKKLIFCWSNGQLDKAIVSHLIENKKVINSVDALINCFRNNKLPELSHSEIKRMMIEKITRDIDSNRITENDEFGALFTKRRNIALQNDTFHILSSIIFDWQNNQAGEQVAKKITGYLTDVISELKSSLDNNLAQQFDELAVHAFLAKVKNSQYADEIIEKVQSISYRITEAMVFENQDENSILRQTIYGNAMQELYGRWSAKELSNEIQEYITLHAFSSLTKLADRIENQVWSRNNGELIAKLETMQRTISHLNERVRSLTERRADINNCNPGENAKPTTVVGFFGK